MKKSISILLFVVTTVWSSAQTTVEISQGESYQNDVYLSLSEGEVSTVSALNWDIAFNVVSGFSDGIRINDGQEAEISLYPNGDINDWDDVDTTGFSEWTRMNNDITAWSVGSLNQGYNESDPFDFGWGIYTGDPDHDVLGDSLYIMKLTDGTHKKLRIDILDSGNWTFTYADVNGDNEVTETFAMSDYPDKKYAYYSMVDGEFVDREPVHSDWDMVLTRYFGETSFGPGGTSGILTNDSVEVAQADDVDVNTANWGDYDFVEDDISVIGNDWKELNEFFEWEVIADRCYFVKDQIGDIYKVIFTSFEGSSTGNVSYTSELVSGVSVNELESAEFVSVYPNPVKNGVLNLVLDQGSNSQKQFFIYSSSGNLVDQGRLNASSGLHNYVLQLQDLNSGMYILQLQGEMDVLQTRFIVE